MILQKDGGTKIIDDPKVIKHLKAIGWAEVCEYVPPSDVGDLLLKHMEIAPVKKVGFFRNLINVMYK